MRDDYHSQTWAENHRQLSETIHKLSKAILAAFETLHAQQFDAPWRARPARRGKAACRPAA